MVVEGVAELVDAGDLVLGLAGGAAIVGVEEGLLVFHHRYVVASLV